MPTSPPLGPCPPWCEKSAGHDWEDEWLNGPIRFHTWTRTIAQPHPHRGDQIRIEEAEQYGADGATRQRTIVLDVQAPTEWDLTTAEIAKDLLAEAVALARGDGHQR